MSRKYGQKCESYLDPMFATISKELFVSNKTIE